MAKDNDGALRPIIEYIERNMKKGYRIEELKWALVNQKHSRTEIERAIKIVQARTPSNQVKDEKIEASIQEIKKGEISAPKERGFWKRLFD